MRNSAASSLVYLLTFAASVQFQERAPSKRPGSTACSSVAAKRNAHEASSNTLIDNIPHGYETTRELRAEPVGRQIPSQGCRALRRLLYSEAWISFGSKTLPAFAQVSTGDLKLILSGPGASGSRPMPDGHTQEPGGLNRIVLQVADLPSRIESLKKAGLHFPQSDGDRPRRQADLTGRSGWQPDLAIRTCSIGVNSSAPNASIHRLGCRAAGRTAKGAATHAPTT